MKSILLKKQTMKGIVVAVFLAAAVSCIIAGIMASPVQAASKNNYWIQGISKAADGNMQMFYKENAIRLKGKAKKAESRKRLQEAEEKKCSYSLKVADDCKVIQLEADSRLIIPYKEWVQDCGHEKGDEISFISAEIKVKNKKIIKIYFSA